jgi:hypothetical protein
MPELTGNDYRSFLKYFSNSCPELREKFPKEFVWSLIRSPFGMIKPQDMSDLDFDQFREIEHYWLVKKGFIQVPTGKISFIQPKSGLLLIKPKELLKLEVVDSNTTKIYWKEQGFECSLNVFGSLESVKNRLNTINK